MKVSAEFDVDQVNMKSNSESDMTEDSNTLPASHLRASTKQRKYENCMEMFKSKTVLEDHKNKTFLMCVPVERCDICRDKFPSKAKLEDHRKKHLECVKGMFNDHFGEE